MIVAAASARLSITLNDTLICVCVFVCLRARVLGEQQLSAERGTASRGMRSAAANLRIQSHQEIIPQIRIYYTLISIQNIEII